MNEGRTERIKEIANLTREQIGDSEESVKINFIVPLLEALGLNRLDYEYNYKDIYVRKGLPQFAKLIIETKSYDKDLTLHLQQLENYCHEERPLLGIIANGTDIRIYSYWWKYRASFQEHLIYLINRRELKNEQTIKVVENILSIESLKSGEAKKYVNEREEEIELAESKIRTIEEKIKDDEHKLKAKIKAYEEKIEEFQTDISKVRQELNSIQTQKIDQIAEIRSALKLPEQDVPRQKTMTESRAPKFDSAAEEDKPKDSRRKTKDRITIELLREGPKMPKEVVEAILKEYPSDDAAVLLRTTERRLSPSPKGYLHVKFGVNICKTEDGRYYIKGEN